MKKILLYQNQIKKVSNIINFFGKLFLFLFLFIFYKIIKILPTPTFGVIKSTNQAMIDYFKDCIECYFVLCRQKSRRILDLQSGIEILYISEMARYQIGTIVEIRIGENYFILNLYGYIFFFKFLQLVYIEKVYIQLNRKNFCNIFILLGV